MIPGVALFSMSMGFFVGAMFMLAIVDHTEGNTRLRNYCIISTVGLVIYWYALLMGGQQ